MHVRWRTTDGIDYVLQEIRPDEMQVFLKNHADAIAAVPTCWTHMEDGDYVWWPNSMYGEPIITNVSLTARGA